MCNDSLFVELFICLQAMRIMMVTQDLSCPVSKPLGFVSFNTSLKAVEQDSLKAVLP